MRVSGKAGFGRRDLLKVAGVAAALALVPLTAGVAMAADSQKMKTHSGAGKRFRLTGTGKVMRRRANRNHMFEHKSSRLTRRLYDEVVVAPSDVKEIKKLLGK